MFELLAQAALLHRQALTHRRCHTDPSLWLLSLCDDPTPCAPFTSTPRHTRNPRSTPPQVVDRRTGDEVEGTAVCVRTAPVRRVAEPVPRRMVPLVPPAPPHVQKGRFTVLTYNILADLYTTTHQFPTTEPFALQWQYRRQVILKELALYDADIVCLQEVQSTSFADDLKDVLDERGFDAVFKKKTQARPLSDLHTRACLIVPSAAAAFMTTLQAHAALRHPEHPEAFFVPTGNAAVQLPHFNAITFVQLF